MLNRTLPSDWSVHWRPSRSPLPEDVEFRGWVLWRLPDCIDFSLPVTAESEQTDARAERILLACRAMATEERFNSVLRIDFNKGGHFSSPVLITQPDNFEKANIEPPLIGKSLLYPSSRPEIVLFVFYSPFDRTIRLFPV